MASRKIFELFGSIVVEGLGDAKKEFTEFQKDLRATNKALNKMGRDAAKAGKAITKGLTVPLGIAAGAVIKFGADFDQAMTNSIAIMGDVSDAMRNDMEMTARQVAKDLNMSVRSMGEAYFFLASAGLDAAESMAALPKVAAFAKAGNFDMAKATDLLTDSQSALGLASADTAEHIENMVMVSDQLIEANKNANASAEQFAEAITNKAGVALNLLGKDLSEGLAVLQVYADKGLAKGADAGTQLNIVLRDLQNAAVQNSKAFDQAGISVFDADGKMNHLADIIDDLDGRFSGMSDETKRGELLMLGFTSKSVDATSALLGTSDAIREYEESLKAAGGATDEVAQKQLQTFWQQLGLVQKRIIDVGLTLWKGLAPILMDIVLPAINAIIGAVESMVNWFGEHKNITAFIATFVAVLAIAGPFLLFFVKVLPMIKKMVTLYKLLTASQVALNTSMTANPIGLIVVGIAALIAAGVLLWKNLDTIKSVWASTWDFISFHFSNISDTIAMGFGSMILGILENIGKLGKWIPGINKALDGLIETTRKSVDIIAAEKEARKALHKEQVISRNLTRDEAKTAAEAAKEAKKLSDEAIEASKKELAEKEKAAKKKKALTLQEIEDNKKKDEKRKKLEADWIKKLEDSTETKKALLESEKQTALSEAEALGADKQKILEYYANEEKKLNKEVADANFKNSQSLIIAQAELEEDQLAKLQIITQQKLDQNEFEKTEAIRIANEKGLNLANITALYKAREDKINADSAVQEVKLANDVKNQKIASFQKVLNAVSTVVNGINELWQAGLDKRLAELDIETEAKKENIENSLLSEEEKATQLAAIDEEADAKKLEIEKEQARRKKLASIMGIILNTAMAVAGALTIPGPPGIVMAAIVGALGAASLAIAIATPIPFAEGGLVKSSPGTGIIAQIGEGTQDEVVLPMKTGAIEIAKGIVGAMGGGFGGVAARNTGSRGGDTHLHVGVLVADNNGLKKLSKMLRPFGIAEDQRTGVA